MKTLLALMIGLLVLVPTQSEADPSSNVQKLMNQPMSMFDFGLNYLEMRIDKLCDGLEMKNIEEFKIMCVVQYEYDTNQIVIRISFRKLDLAKYFDSSTPVKIYIDHIRDNVVQDLRARSNLYFGGFFKRGYVDVGVDIDLDELKSIVKLNIGGTYKKDYTTIYVRCASNLDGTNKMWSE